MPDVIQLKGSRYYHYACMMPGASRTDFLADVQNRQSFVSNRKVKLDRTNGAYVVLGLRPLLFVIDRRTVEVDVAEWGHICEIAHHLEACWPALSQHAKDALASLHAVVFTTTPARAYADVKPNSFVYDVDELKNELGTLVSAAFASSNIVHDANHVWMYNNGLDYAGLAAEAICWSLQIDNAAALGLAEWEVDFLRTLVANPQIARPHQARPIRRHQEARLFRTGEVQRLNLSRGEVHAGPLCINVPNNAAQPRTGEGQFLRPESFTKHEHRRFGARHSDQSQRVHD